MLKKLLSVLGLVLIAAPKETRVRIKGKICCKDGKLYLEAAASVGDEPIQIPLNIDFDEELTLEQLRNGELGERLSTDVSEDTDVNGPVLPKE